MGPDTIWILIPLAGMGIGALGTWTRHQRQLAEIRANAGNADLAATSDYVRDLEERVRVLERIVTDKSTDVAAQIEALRDPAPAPRSLADSRN